MRTKAKKRVTRKKAAPARRKAVKARRKAIKKVTRKRRGSSSSLGNQIKKSVTKFFNNTWNVGFAFAIVAAGLAIWRMQKPLQIETPAPVLETRTQTQTDTNTKANREVASDDSVAKWKASFAGKFSQTKNMTAGERMVFWSDFLANVNPQEPSPLHTFGSGPHIEDTAPLVVDTFDCTTYVETVAALAKSESPDDFFTNLIKIRYKDGKADFTNRNHFPEADWIPNNERVGTIKDVTEQIAEASGVKVLIETKRINRAQWLSRQLKTGKVSRDVASTTEHAWPAAVNAKVSYIPVSEVSRVLDHLPNGTILNIVRKDNSKHPVLITHQGIIVRKGNQVFFRHASAGKFIRTIELSKYLQDMTHRYGNWLPVGINLNQISG
jgi:hypothetical protein